MALSGLWVICQVYGDLLVICYGYMLLYIIINMKFFASDMLNFSLRVRNAREGWG